MVRTFCSAIYLRLKIVMCFKKHLIFGDDPLFPDGKDFGDVSRQNVMTTTSWVRGWQPLQNPWADPLCLDLQKPRKIKYDIWYRKVHEAEILPLRQLTGRCKTGSIHKLLYWLGMKL